MALQISPCVGALEVSGMTVDEITALASERIRRFAGEHSFAITRVDASPLFESLDQAARLRRARVEFEISG